MNRNKIGSWLIIALLMASATLTVVAQDADTGPNWRIVDLYYHHEFNRHDNREADFLGIRASSNVREHGLFRIETNGGSISNRINGVNRDYNGYQQSFLGGVRYAASPQADIFLLGGATRVEFETNDYNLNRHGFISQFGMRGMLTPNVDITSYFQWQKNGGMSTTSWHGEARYRAWRRLDIYTAVGIYANDRSGRIGLSFHF